MELLNRLESSGLTNRHSEDLGILATNDQRLIPIAYCGSLSCVRIRKTGQRSRKEVARNAKLCPDCGHALQWKVVRLS